MSKERLEQIKNKQNFDHLNNNLVIGFDGPTFVSINNNDYVYLVRQNELLTKVREQNIIYRDSINLALNHIHTGNFNLATVALNKALLKEVDK